MRNFGLLLIFLLIQINALAQIEIYPAPSSGIINLNSGSQNLYFINKSSSLQNLNISVSESSMPVGTSSFYLLNGTETLTTLQYIKSSLLNLQIFYLHQ